MKDLAITDVGSDVFMRYKMIIFCFLCFSVLWFSIFLNFELCFLVRGESRHRINKSKEKVKRHIKRRVKPT